MGTTPTSDIAAWQCFQQALFQIGTDDPVQWSIGKDRLTHAIGLDPNFASALAILAVLRVRLFTIDWPNSTGFLEVAEHEAKRAVALRPELAFTHMAIGSVYAAQGQWVRAEESFVTAAGLDEEWPIVGAIHIAHVLLSVGHLKRALVLTTSSQAQPHGMIGILLIYAITYFANDCDEEALKLLALIQALGGRPHQPHLVELFIMAASRAGRVDEVIRLHNASLGPSILAAAGEDVVTTVVNALATQQGKPGAVDALDRLMARLAPAQATQTLRSRVLTWYTRLNGVDRAFALGHSMLDDFILQGTTGVFWGFLWSPEMQAFREDSRFDYFATRIGLTEYWQRFGPPS